MVHFLVEEERVKGERNLNNYQWYSEQWGKETRDDRQLFLLLTVGVFQAGLSWKAAAGKREAFYRNFCEMDFRKVAAFFPDDIERILEDKEMIRNPRKIQAVVKNARAIVNLLNEYDSFSDYLWGFVDDVPAIHTYETEDEVPTVLPEATLIAKDMKKRGFSFVGPVVTYMFLKSAGIIQDHVLNKEN